MPSEMPSLSLQQPADGCICYLEESCPVFRFQSFFGAQGPKIFFGFVLLASLGEFPFRQRS